MNQVNIILQIAINNVYEGKPVDDLVKRKIKNASIYQILHPHKKLRNPKITKFRHILENKTKELR